MKYFLVLLHSKPFIKKINFEKAHKLLEEFGIEKISEFETIVPPYPYDTFIQFIMLTDDLILFKWNK